MKNFIIFITVIVSISAFSKSSKAQSVKVTFGVDMRTTDSFDYYTPSALVKVNIYKNKVLQKQIKCTQQANKHLFLGSDIFNTGDTLNYLFYNAEIDQFPQYEQLNKSCTNKPYRELIVPANDTFLGYPLFYNCRDSSELVNVTFRVIGKYEKYEQNKTINVEISKDTITKSNPPSRFYPLTINQGKYRVATIQLIRGDTHYLEYYSMHGDFAAGSECFGRRFRKQPLIAFNDTILTPVMVGQCDTNYVYEQTIVLLEKNGTTVLPGQPVGIYPKGNNGVALDDQNSKYYFDTLYLSHYVKDSIKYRFDALNNNEYPNIKGGCLDKDGFRPAVYVSGKDTTIYACFMECQACERSVVFRVRVLDTKPQIVGVMGNFNGYISADANYRLTQFGDTSTHVWYLQKKFRRFDTIRYKYVLKNSIQETVPDSCADNGYRTYIVGEDGIQYLPTYQFGTCNPDNFVFGNSGLDELAVQSFRIFPNPTDNGLVNLDLSNMQGNLLLELTDMLGKTQLTEQVKGGSTSQLKLGDLSSGCYFINLYREKQLVAANVLMKQ